MVVLVNPLLIEMGAHRTATWSSISTETETQVARTVARGMDEADVRRGLPPNCRSRNAPAADVLLDNEGSLEDLEREVAVLWTTLATRATEA